MAVNLLPPVAADLKPIEGVKLATASAGIKKPGRQDVVLIEIAEGSHTAAVYTRNAFCAAPVVLCREHQQQASPRYLLINSGNANAGTGDLGMQAAKRSCQAVASLTNVSAQSVLPFSTGVIGQQLPVEKIEAVLPSAVADLQADNWFAAANAIMTTDTIAKAQSVECQLGDQTVTLTGIAKGAGMIRPDMATMLSYIATDAVISETVLNSFLKQSMDQSFNRITVDGDTSTNDACVLIATGKAGNAEINSLESDDAKSFMTALNKLSRFLAEAIVRDGEGATKFIAINVHGGADAGECRQVAYTIAHSPLVKTALFASDPNWGRILAAVGRSGLDNLDLSKIDIALDDVAIVTGGQPDVDYTETKGQQVMDQSEITIHVTLGRGQAEDLVWTCDFSYDYVKINAEYRT